MRKVKATQRKEYKLPPTRMYQVLSKETIKQLNALKKELMKEMRSC